MKELAILDRKNYDLSAQRYITHSAKAIIIADKKIAMVYSNKYKFYVFPGGTVEKNETLIEALVREVKEETGLIVKQESIKELGMLTEIRKDLKIDNGIYERNEYYYFCDVEDGIFEQDLTLNEAEAGCELKFVTVDEAISQNESGIKIYTEATTFVLKYLKGNLKNIWKG